MDTLTQQSAKQYTDTGPLAEAASCLVGKRVAMLVLSEYPADPRPRRAAETLIQEGMAVDLLCVSDERLPKKEGLGPLTIFRIPIRHRRGGYLAYAYEYFAFILVCATILASRTIRRRYDLVYVHNMPDILVFSALVPKIFGAKIVLDQHDPMPELMRTIFQLDETSIGYRLICLLEKWSIARAHLVITVNLACKRMFGARSCDPEKIGVVMNSPDGKIFPCRSARSYPSRASGQPFIIMYHGSLVERNGLALAIDALAQVCETIPTAELRIYGRRTPYLDEIMCRIHDLHLESYVCYLGPQSLQDLVHEIEKCDVGIIPNHRNAFTEINTPTRIFEYLALGKPVIAPLTRGITDYFDQGSLLFFECGDPQSLAEKLREVYFDPELGIQTAERGQQVYLAHTWQHERSKLVSLLDRLLGEGRPCQMASLHWEQ